jgi:hypothetical protein
VFHDAADDQVVHSRVKAGERAQLPDPPVAFEEQQLEVLMKRCWEAIPSQRIDIFQAVTFLRHAVAASRLLLNETV